MMKNFLAQTRKIVQKEAVEVIRRREYEDERTFDAGPFKAVINPVANSIPEVFDERGTLVRKVWLAFGFAEPVVFEKGKKRPLFQAGDLLITADGRTFRVFSSPIWTENMFQLQVVETC